jgi:tRNA-splicing ligase RtcB (3'-phosphate/5'-hydroxy nucleic acid ligase)
MDEQLQHYGIELPDRQLSCAPLDSPEGKDYLGAMACAANYACVQPAAYHSRRAQRRRPCLGLPGYDVLTIYDVAHNIAKIETFADRQYCVHRKGATRAFGPGSSDLPEDYQSVGQPVFIPGSMGTGSWVLTGDVRSLSRSWGAPVTAPAGRSADMRQRSA